MQNPDEQSDSEFGHSVPEMALAFDANSHKCLFLGTILTSCCSVFAMFPSKTLWDVVSKPFKRSQLGLFQGKTKLYGNNVPFSKHKTRRSWLPNVQQKRVDSQILGEKIRLKVTTRALRTIKKVRETHICF